MFLDYAEAPEVGGLDLSGLSPEHQLLWQSFHAYLVSGGFSIDNLLTPAYVENFRELQRQLVEGLVR